MNSKPWSVWIGFDPREAAAFSVCRSSILYRLIAPVPVRGIVLEDLRRRGLYTRPTEKRGGQLWDVLSDAPMSTEFAVSRFLVPHLAGSGWALFLDADMLVRVNLARLFEQADDSKAVYVVKHKHEPPAGTKMDGQEQTRYFRKNWSSAVLWNVSHPSNRRLTVEMINRLPGRELHRFCWLKDREIGTLGPEWNYLVGTTKLPRGREPKIVHWTDGIPLMKGHEHAEYAEEFFAELQRWAA